MLPNGVKDRTLYRLTGIINTINRHYLHSKQASVIVVFSRITPLVDHETDLVSAVVVPTDRGGESLNLLMELGVELDPTKEFVLSDSRVCDVREHQHGKL